MIYLLFSILSSTIIFVVFKLFARYGVNTLQAITINYLIASVAGILLYEDTVQITALPTQSWFPGALLLGTLFIIVFNLMALTTQRNGLAVVSVATKMSVVLPIAFGIYYYRESMGVLKVLGILLALSAVCLASAKKTMGLKSGPKHLLFPVLVFLGSGIIDTSLKYLESNHVSQNDVPIFLSVIFATAFCIGVIILLPQALKGTLKLALKNLLGGIALGIPNYFSIYFLILALRGKLDSSTLFTLNNISIVLLSTCIGLLVFGERLTKKNSWGIALAMVAIVLISFSV